jgi:hypothetical protein
MDANHTPSAEEFTGYYNVSAPKKRRDRRQSYLETVPNPPALRLEEAVDVSRVALDVICGHANNHGFSPEEVRKYYECSNNVQIDDRTLSTMFEPCDYTLELIDHLQRLLLLHHSLWRIRIVGSTDATTIMIYPSRVRYGSLPDDPDEEEALSTIVKQLMADEPMSRQIGKTHQETVKRLAGEAIRAGFSKRFELLVGFDNDEGDFSKVTIWTLCKSDTPELRLPSTVEYMVSNKYYAKMNGDFGPHVLDCAPFWVTEWIFSGRELPRRLPFIVSDANYRESVVEIDVNPLQFVKESPR